LDNHYHLLIETPDGNLSIGIRQLNGVYAQMFNKSIKVRGLKSPLTFSISISFI